MNDTQRIALSAALNSGVLTQKEFDMLQLALAQTQKGSVTNRLASALYVHQLMERVKRHYERVVAEEQA